MNATDSTTQTHFHIKHTHTNTCESTQYNESLSLTLMNHPQTGSVGDIAMSLAQGKILPTSALILDRVNNNVQQ